MEAFDWSAGVYAAATMGSETTAAATGKVGVVRRDPMAMIPFCGYNMADYFGHWLKIGRTLAHPPKIFTINWFRTDGNGKFIWPGFGENMRVLKWMVERCQGTAQSVKTQIGLMPKFENLNWTGLESFGPEQFAMATSLDTDEWRAELRMHDELLDSFAGRLPVELRARRSELDRVFS